MYIAGIRLELFIPGAFNLKDKRRVLSKLKDRLKNKFNISVCEVDFNEQWQRAALGVALVSNDNLHLRHMIDAILRFMESFHDFEVVKKDLEIF